MNDTDELKRVYEGVVASHGRTVAYYNIYLKSQYWRVLRISVMKRDEFQCKLCGSKNSLQVHHISYDNLFNEQPEDLVTLCHGCHLKQHGDDIPRGHYERTSPSNPKTLKGWDKRLMEIQKNIDKKRAKKLKENEKKLKKNRRSGIFE